LLKDAQNGDLKAETALVQQVALEVLEHAKNHKENLQGKHVLLTRHAFYPYIYRNNKSQEDIADQLNVSRGTYRRMWAPRIEAIREQWVRRLIDEAEK
jgi:hypothetical protein